MKLKFGKPHLILFFVLLSACKTSDLSDSTKEMNLETDKFTAAQQKEYTDCQSEKVMSNKHCAIYSVAKGEIYEGTVKVLNEEYAQRWNHKLKTGHTCQISFVYGQSTMFGIPNGGDYFVDIVDSKNLESPGTHYMSNQTHQAFRTFSKGLIDKRLKWLGYWIRHDQNFRVTSIGENVHSEDPGFSKVGDPIWECTITSKTPQPK